MQSMEGYPKKPKFDGETKQSVTWINKVKELSYINKILSDDEKVKYASMQLEGWVEEYEKPMCLQLGHIQK